VAPERAGSLPPASSKSRATYPPRTGGPPRRALIKPGVSRQQV